MCQLCGFEKLPKNQGVAEFYLISSGRFAKYYAYLRFFCLGAGRV